MRRVCVTRAEPGASATAARLIAHGLDPLLAPLSRIEPVEALADDPAGAAAFAVTSANAVRAFSAVSTLRDRPLFAVGDATAAAARAAGFAAVLSAEGDVDALAGLIADRWRPHDGPVWHLRGEMAAGDLGGALSALGYAVHEAVVYRAIGSATLPDALAGALSARAIDAILFHAPAAARSFARLAEGIDLSFCAAATISRAAAAPLAALGLARIAIASAPTEAALFAALDAALA
jgi:uroporphyrinogen-III synthase